MRDKILLRQLQALPLSAKVLMTQQRIREWYQYWNGKVVISFSGGKDSTVLAHLVHDLYPEVPMVFANTGLEYPEIQAFAREMGAEFVRPKMSFSEVISKYGYPIISKEVAEAIGWARRITPSDLYSGGGVQLEARFKRIELRGERKTGRGRNCTVSGTTNCYPPPNRITRTNWMEESKSYRQHASTPPRTKFTSKKRQDLSGTRKCCYGEKTCQDNEWITRKIERFRRQLMGKD